MKISINAVLTLCVLLFSIVFLINVGIGSYFVYYKSMNRDKESGGEKKNFFSQQLLGATL